MTHGARRRPASRSGTGDSARGTLDQVTEPTLAGTEPAATQLGPYRLLQSLGEGGMGTVYLAEQLEPVERTVALKVIRSTLSGAIARGRFAAERQAMARLSHRNVARMFEAGTTDDGQPYFAMEYVEGPRITEFCDEHRLVVDARLQLFLGVCAGVLHAHQRGIIHRDLKPSNILVCEVDGQPVPKVIDFGIAKALDGSLSDTALTGTDLVGTPSYMSPESLHLDDGYVDVDTRADVYSLGVLLYELLVGLRPFGTKGAGMAQIVRLITETEAPVPSARLSKQPEEIRAEVAESRRTGADALERRLSGDLDWIVAKAIAKNRDERYESVGDLAADIDRYLTDQPVLASPPSRAYRMRKFVRRHRVGVSAATLVVLALLVGAAGITVGMLRANREAKRANMEAERANLEAATATAVSDFVTELFEVSDPSESLGNAVTARELLDEGAERIDTELADQPLLQARLMDVIGRVYRSLGLYGEARPLLERALELREAHSVGEPLEIAESMHELGRLLRLEGDYAASETLVRAALESRTRLLGREHEDVASSLRELASLLRKKGDLRGAEPIFREAVEIARRLHGSDHESVASALNNLGAVLEDLGDAEGSDRCVKEALSISRRLHGDHPSTVVHLSNYATTLMTRSSYADAEPVMQEALDMARRVYPEGHSALASCLIRMAFFKVAEGNLDDAESMYREALEMWRRLVGDDHPNLIEALGGLASVMTRRGDFEAALVWNREAVAMSRRLLGPDHFKIAASLSRLAETLRKKKDYEAAENYYLEAMEMFERVAGPGSPRIASILGSLASVNWEQRDLDDAASYGKRSIAMYRQASGKDPWQVGQAILILAYIDIENGDLAEAEAKVREAVEIYLGSGLPAAYLIRPQWTLAEVLVGLDRYGEAESILLPLLESDYEPALPKTRQRLVKLYTAWDKPNEAERYR